MVLFGNWGRNLVLMKADCYSVTGTEICILALVQHINEQELNTFISSSVFKCSP